MGKNLLVIFLFTCKVASSSPPWTFANLSFTQSVNKQGCVTGHYIELQVWLSRQHEQAQRLYVCVFVHRQIYPRLVYFSRPRSFLKH